MTIDKIPVPSGSPSPVHSSALHELAYVHPSISVTDGFYDGKVIPRSIASHSCHEHHPCISNLNHHVWLQVRYIVDAQPVILESGTKQAALPAELYGCPYPPAPGQPRGTCAAPDTCNCHNGICYGSCKGGLANEQRRR